MNSPDDDCAAQAMYHLPSAEAAKRFVAIFPSVIAGKTGRHTYTEWDQVLIGAGAAHPAMNPYLMPANAECRRTYSRDMCAGSLDDPRPHGHGSDRPAPQRRRRSTT